MTTLRELIVPGPIERGLYFMDAGADAASRVQERIVDLLWWDSVAAPGTMPACLPSRLRLRGGYAGQARHDGKSAKGHRRYSRIGSMFWIDTGHSFNRDALMAQARLRGMDSQRVSRAVHVQHPMGPLSYLELLEKIPNAALCALGNGERVEGPTAFTREAQGEGRPSNSIWWTPLVIISDLMGPLCDPRLPASDRSRISMHVLERLAHLSERAIVLAMLPQTGDRFMTQEFLRLGTLLRTGSAGAPESRPYEPAFLREGLPSVALA